MATPDMSNTPLTTREFDLWVRHLDQRFDRIEARLSALDERTIEHGERLAAFNGSARRAGQRWGAAGGLLGGLIAGFFSWLSR